MTRLRPNLSLAKPARSCKAFMHCACIHPPTHPPNTTGREAAAPRPDVPLVAPYCAGPACAQTYHRAPPPFEKFVPHT